MNRLLAISLAIAGFGLFTGRARLTPETRHFTYTGARDEVAGGETITRNGDLISGDMAMGAKHVHYEGRIAADGTVPRLDMRVWRSAAEAKHPRAMAVVIGGDTTRLIEHLEGRVDTLRFPSQPGLVPVINPSVGLAELVVARARSQKSRSARIPILLIDALDLDSPAKDKVGAAPATLDVTFLAGDTVRIGNGTSTDQMRVIVGVDGLIRGGGSGSTAKDKFAMRPTTKPVSSRE